jgi:hypothetical protein
MYKGHICDTIWKGYHVATHMYPSVKPRCKLHNAWYCDACPADVGLNPDDKG